MLFITNQNTSDNISFTQRIFRVLPTLGSEMLFGLLWLLWLMFGLPGAPLESRECCVAPEHLLWCFLVFLHDCVCKKYESEAFSVRLIWQRILHHTLHWPHTHAIFIPSSVKKAVLCSRSWVGDFHTHWFSWPISCLPSFNLCGLKQISFPYIEYFTDIYTSFCFFFGTHSIVHIPFQKRDRITQPNINETFHSFQKLKVSSFS